MQFKPCQSSPQRKWTELRARDLAHANIGRRYWPVEFTSIPPGKARNLVGQFALDLHARLAQGDGFIFIGQNDTGKTYLAMCLAKWALHYGYDVLVVSAAEYMDKLRSQEMLLNGRDPRQAAQEVDLLVIEDLGKEYRHATTGFAESALENLLRYRVQNQRTTIFTTNLMVTKQRNDLERVYRESFVSLLREAALPVEVNARGWRKDIQRKMRRRADPNENT